MRTLREMWPGMAILIFSFCLGMAIPLLNCDSGGAACGSFGKSLECRKMTDRERLYWKDVLNCMEANGFDQLSKDFPYDPMIDVIDGSLVDCNSGKSPGCQNDGVIAIPKSILDIDGYHSEGSLPTLGNWRIWRHEMTHWVLEYFGVNDGDPGHSTFWFKSDKCINRGLPAPEFVEIRKILEGE